MAMFALTIIGTALCSSFTGMAGAATTSSIAFIRDGDVWTCTWPTGATHRLTRTTAWEAEPAWSPNGSRLVVVRTPLDKSTPVYRKSSLIIMSRNGSNSTFVPILNHRALRQADFKHPFWSPAGTTLIVTAKINGRYRILLIDSRSRRARYAPINGHVPEDYYHARAYAWRKGSGELLVQLSGMDASQMATLSPSGKVRTIASGLIDGSGVWSRDGRRLALCIRKTSEDMSSPGIATCSITLAGASRVIESLDPDLYPAWPNVGSPSWSPNAEQLCFEEFLGGDAAPSVKVYDLANGQTSTLLQDAWQPCWGP